MEPGEYLTNVLSSNNFASINYEYFETQTSSTGTTRKHFQRLETGWRQDGRLVLCDPFRDGIWVFSPNTSANTQETDISTVTEAHDVGLLQRDKGIYEPASLGKGKQAISNNTSTPSSSSSPSSSLDSTIRNAQALNGRSVQTNSTLGAMQEPPTPSPGARSATGADASTSLKDIHEYFISAVLGSIVYYLCRDYGFISLNSRTLILSPLNSPSRRNFANKYPPVTNTVELATLDISLTTLGTLIVKAYSDMVPGIQTLSNGPGSLGLSPKLVPGTTLWLAPGGHAAKFYSYTDDKKVSVSLSTGQIHPDPADQRLSGISPLTIKSWKLKCLEWLSTKGLNSSALEEGGWVFVQVLGSHAAIFSGDYRGFPVLEEAVIVPWPSLLCFQTSNHYLQTIGASVTGPRDSLAFAEDWFKGKDERANTVLKRQKERQAAEMLSKEQADVEARALQSIINSPAALRRGSNAGAMYPTPPDAPHHPIGATPSFDGTVSTPGNPLPFASQEAGTSNQLNSGSNETDAELWGSSGKKERINSGMNFNDNDNDNANMFGDIGGDIFGTDDITDADFSFFDEPDAIQPDEKPESPALVALAAVQETADLEGPFESNDANGQSLDDTLMDMLGPKSGGHDNDEALHPAKADILEDLSSHEISTADLSIHDGHFSQAAITLPFNKETVFKQLIRGPDTVPRPNEPGRASLFNRVDFEDALLSVNKKYDVHGQFNFSTKLKPQQKPNSSALPRTQYLSSRRRTGDDRHNFGSLARILNPRDMETPTNRIEPMDYLMDSDGASQHSEPDDTSHTSDAHANLTNLGPKRKWDNEQGDDMVSTFDGLAMDLDHSASTPQSISGSQLPLLDVDPADWSLTNYFSTAEPDVQSNSLSDLERIATAQILADQAVSGTIQIPRIAGSEAPSRLNRSSGTKELMHSVSRAAQSCLKDITNCTMRAFLEIQGIPILNQGLRLPPRPMNPRGPNSVDAARFNNPFPIAPPQLEVRRSESKLSVLPAAITFWENLGLGPSRGAKDVSAICIYPEYEGVAANANTFLDQMRSVYESSRLGSHDNLVTKDLENGLMPFSVEFPQQSKFHHLTALKDATSRLSRILAAAPAKEKNFVVYFVYPVDNGALLVHICSAFQHLFNLYRKLLSEKRASSANELVLQLIPLDFISSPTSLAVPHPSEYFRLVMEVYDRCIDFTLSSSTPAIMLEQPLPKSIDFKLNVNPSASLLQENTCLHIAYAQSIDDRWITAAWTDNRGTQQMTASYCLGRKNEPISMPFSDVANEIWATTLDFISSKRIHWRIMIARVGVMDPSEIDSWTSLASTESDAQVTLTLLAVQTDPSLRLLPASITLSPNGNTANSVVTPVSTPQPLQSSMVSPGDAATPARENASVATPSEGPLEPDSDARLIDFTDQSWGAVLSHRLNNSNSLMELNPALISGYLIKRGGVNADDAPIVMEVNIVYGEVLGNPRTFHEGLLREILGYYRGLGTLARVRGLVDSVRDVRPWHVAAAEKAVKALYMLM